MTILKKLGATLTVVGVVGILGPVVGLSLRGLRAGESKVAGVCLAGVGVIVWILAIIVEKAQDAVQTRRQNEMQKHAREPDDVIK